MARSVSLSTDLHRLHAAVILGILVSNVRLLSAADSPMEEMLTLEPSRVTMTSTLNWNRHDPQRAGQPPDAQQLLQIEYLGPAVLGDGSRVVQIRDLALQEVVTDSGEALTMAHRNRHLHASIRQNHRPQAGQPRHSMWVNLQLELPTLPATNIASLIARGTASVAMGAPQEVRIPVQGLQSDHQVLDHGLPPGALTILSVTPGQQVVYRINRSAANRIGAVRYLNAANQEVSTRGSSGRGNGQHTTSTVRVALPSDGFIVVMVEPPLSERPLMLFAIATPLPAVPATLPATPSATSP